jgi:hypothetical protein
MHVIQRFSAANVGKVPRLFFASGSCRKSFASQTVTGANRMRYEYSLREFLFLASIAAMICLFAVVVTYDPYYAYGYHRPYYAHAYHHPYYAYGYHRPYYAGYHPY